MLSKRIALLFMVVGLITLAGCNSSSTPSSSPAGHLAFVTLPNSNGVAAFRINTNTSNSSSGSDTAKFTAIVGSPFPTGNSPSSVLIHPSQQFVYVSNQNENDISLFTINSTVGSLQEVLPRTLTGLTPSSLVADSTGSYLYALNRQSANISVFSINSTTGALSEIVGSPFATFPYSMEQAISPSGKFLYVLNTDISSVFAYTITSGALTPVAGLPVKVGNGAIAITVDPAETFVYVANSSDNTVSVLSINSTTGALTLLGSYPTGTTPTSVIALDPYLYVVNKGSSNISAFTITPVTGVLTEITDSPITVGNAPLFAVLDPDNLFVYLGSQSANTISAFSIVTSTGLLSNTSQTATTASPPSSMAVTK
jgi:6-phosphogluconolactonase (cycloisomerase 2 family)